jgi:hypothetical protein
MKEDRMRQTVQKLTVMMVSSVVVGGVLVFATVDQAASMSLFRSDNHGRPQQTLTGKANGGSQGANPSSGNTNFSYNASPVTVTPEPSTIALMASGLIGIGLWRLRKKS